MRNKEEIVYREKDNSGINTAKVLIEALPYIQRLSDTKIVIKLGGNSILYEGLKNIYPFQVEPDDQVAFYRSNSGLWTISQLPIKLKEQITFSKFKDTDWMASKGAKLFSYNKKYTNPIKS